MTRLRLAAAAVNQTPLAWDNNRRHILAAIAAARGAGVSVLCLPELCITGYGCEDMLLAGGVQQTAAEMLLELVPETEGIVISLGLPVYHEGSVYNAAALACDGRLLGIAAKQHLAGDGIHYEPRWFRRWQSGTVGTIELGGREYPIGDLLFECGGVRIGFEICRDAWVADRTGVRLAERGADILLNPSASHFAFAKQQIRERFVLEGSRAFCVSYAYANLLGNESGRAIYDGGTLIASGGAMLARGPRFSYGDFVLTTAVVDVAETRRSRSTFFDQIKPAAPDSKDSSVTADFEWPAIAAPVHSATYSAGVCEGIASDKLPSGSEQTLAAVPGHPVWESGAHQKEEEFARAVPLALFDYLRKSRSRGAVVSLSGGADSSAVAVMVYLLAGFGGGELGIRAIGRSTGLRGDRSPRARRAAADLCLPIHAATAAKITRNAARTIAAATGAEFLEWNVDAVGQRLRRNGLEGHRPQAHLGTRRRRAAKHPSPRPRPRRLDARQSPRRAAALHQQPQRGGRRLRHDGRRHLRRPRAPSPASTRRFLLDWLKWMETTGPAGIGPLPAPSPWSTSSNPPPNCGRRAQDKPTKAT